MTEPDRLFDEGLALYRAGQFDAAEQMLLAAARAAPDHADTWHVLGEISGRTGQTELAAERFAQVLTLDPDRAEAHLACGAALAGLRRYAEALVHYEAAIAARPYWALAFINHAATLAALRRFTAALASCDRAIVLAPDDPRAHFNRGNIARDLHRYDDALVSYEAALTLAPNHAASWNNRGVVLLRLGRPEDALNSHDRAISLAPSAEAHNNRGTALAELGRFDDAVNSYDAALALRPDHAVAHKNRASALAASARLDDALAGFDRAIALQPDFAEALADRAATLICLGRIEPALRDSNQAIALQPDSVEAQFNKGLCHLALGQFRPGWEGFEWRWKSRYGPPHPQLPGAHWTGDTPVDGKTVLVVAEQGAGDSLQFCRYLPMLARRAKVILAMPRPLARLMARMPEIEHIVSADDPLPRFDEWVPIMTLPMAFGTTLDTIPAPIPYLAADPQRTAIWRQRLDSLPGRKVGLVWAGSPFSKLPRAQAMDRRRSITLAHYAPLAALPGFSLVSLQKGEAGRQPRPPGMTLHDWTDELGDYADTADLVAALDLVISVDTSVVHLAGALGKPVWVLNRYDQCWRWLQNRTDNPWYPTARLFRQPAPGDWCSVIRDVTAALRQELPE